MSRIRASRLAEKDVAPLASIAQHPLLAEIFVASILRFGEAVGVEIQSFPQLSGDSRKP
jgi:hypothetical protein